MKSSLTEQILQKISEENMRPTPRWRFIVRETAVWTAVSLTGVFAAASIGLASYRFMSGDVRALFAAGVPWYQLLLVIGWSGAFVCLFLLVLYEVRCTKRGYRFSLVAISGAGSLVIIGVAGVVYSTGMVHMAERHMARMIPTYLDAGSAREQFWSSPNEGRLLGYVITEPAMYDEPATDVAQISTQPPLGATSSGEMVIVHNEAQRMMRVEDRAGRKWTVLIDPEVPDTIDITNTSSSSFVLLVGARAEQEIFFACGVALYGHTREWKEERNPERVAVYPPDQRPFDGYERLIRIVRTKNCAPRHTDMWQSVQ